MAKYYGTYSCGHEGVTNIIGPTKNREWIKERHFEKLCPDCWEQKRIEEMEKANAEALAKAKEMELPNLEGTEKQVAWANTLRQNFIEKVEKIDKPTMRIIELNEEDKITIINFVIRKTKASWFIDNTRTSCFLDFIENILVEAKKEVKITEEEPIVKDIKVEATVYPENKISNAVVEIAISDNSISAKFEKNDKFRDVVKSLNFKWEETKWVRNINELTGSSNDRAAELGNKLLNAGFPIIIMDSITRQNAIEGKFEAECNRWIKGKEDGNLVIRWWEDNDKLYKMARSLPGSKWIDKSVVVNLVHHKEVEDFADLQGFKFTRKAHELIDAEKNKTKVFVAPIKVKKQEAVDGLKNILNQEEAVLDDLKD